MNKGWWPWARIVVCCIWFLAGFPAQPVLAENLVTRLQSHSKSITSFQASFQQEKILAMFSRPVLFSGRLTIVRPDRLRWEFTRPTISALIFAGDQGLRCDENGQSASFDLRSDPVMRVVAEQLWLWLGGDYSRLNEKYELVEQDASTLQVFPRQSGVKEYIEQVTIRFDPTLLQPELVEIHEAGGDRTRIHFSSYTVNGQYPQKLFTGCTPND